MKSNKSKKFLCEIAFLAVLNFFPVQKLIFGHFWNCKKWNSAKKKNHEIDLFDFTCFLAWTFLNFLAHCEKFYLLKIMKLWYELPILWIIYLVVIQIVIPKFSQNPSQWLEKMLHVQKYFDHCFPLSLQQLKNQFIG